MYELLKKITKNILGKNFIKGNEVLFRNIVYQFYRGNNFYCNLCERGLRKFTNLSNGERLCPNCGSLGRTRRLFSLVKNQIDLQKNQRMLEFSPPRCNYKKYKSILGENYISTDFENEFLADKKLDITNTGEPNEAYDSIICFHVLEHIPKDEAAMVELKRILKRGGVCFIQTPFKEGEIYEDYTITNPSDRLKHFGQEDHVRIYSVAGLAQRLENAGFKVEVKNFVEKKNNYFGYKSVETILVVM